MGRPEFRDEADADLTSLRDDYYSFRSVAERAPTDIRYFAGDVARDIRTLASDFSAETRSAAHRVMSFLHAETDEADAAQ